MKSVFAGGLFHLTGAREKMHYYRDDDIHEVDDYGFGWTLRRTRLLERIRDYSTGVLRLLWELFQRTIVMDDENVAADMD